MSTDRFTLIFPLTIVTVLSACFTHVYVELPRAFALVSLFASGRVGD